MVASLRRQLRELQQFRDDVVAGVYAQRSPLGPGALAGNLLKAKTVTANLMDISELAAITANTGQLTVTEALIAGSGLNTMGYDPAQGLYLGNAVPASAPFRVTPTGAAAMTGATVSGGITATTLTANGSGSIAGWTIDSSKLSQGNTGIGNSGSYRIWSGNLASPSLANFSVDSSGSIKSAGGTIGGMTVSSADMQIGTSGGIGNNSGYRLWAGASSPGASPFRVDSVGSLTSTSGSFSGSLSGATGSFTGSVTTSSLDANGGSIGNLTVDGVINLGAGGKIQDADGSYWDSTGIVLKSGGAEGDVIKWQMSGSDRGSIWANSTSLVIASATGYDLGLNGRTGIYLTVGSGYGITFGIDNGAAGSQFNSAGNLLLYNRIYPGNAGQQVTGYMAWDGAQLQLTGADVYIPFYLRLAQYGTTGSGALPNPTKWFAVKDSAGVARYIPAYSSPNAWAA